MKRLLAMLLVAVGPAVVVPVAAAAHEGDSEERAIRLLGLLLQLDRQWVAVQQEADAGQRAALLAAHRDTLRATQLALREAADRSPCVMLEKGDPDRQFACLVDTEARLRATDRVMDHLLRRESFTAR